MTYLFWSRMESINFFRILSLVDMKSFESISYDVLSSEYWLLTNRLYCLS